MSNHDGEIRIRATIDDKKIDKDMQKLSEKLARQNESLNRQGTIVEKLKDKYDKLVNKMVQTKEEFGLTKQIKKASEELEKFQNKLDEKQFKLVADTSLGLKNEGLAEEISKLTSKITVSKTKIKELKNELDKIKLDPKSAESVKILEKEIENATLKERRLTDEIIRTQKEISKLGSSKIGFFKNIKNSLGNAFSGLAKQSSGVSTAISGITGRILNMAKTVFIFNLLNKGFEQISEGIKNVVTQDSVLVNSLNKIKANLLTAFAPIFYACLPALRALGRALSWVSGLIASVVSRLFGKTINQSQQMAKKLYDSGQNAKKLGNEMKNTAKNTKKAAGELASFDKIEVLNKKENEIKAPQISDVGASSGIEPLKFPVQIEFEAKNADLIDKITRIFQAMWRIVNPIISGIRDDITWLWDTIFGKNSGNSWLDSIAVSFENIADFMDEHPLFKDFLVSIGEGFIIAAIGVGVFTAAVVALAAIDWVFLAIAVGIGALIFAIKNWGEICEWFKKVWKKFTNWIKENWEGLILALGAVAMVFSPVVGVIIGAIVGIIEAIKNWGKITEWFGKKWTEFTNWISGIWDNIKQGWKRGINGLISLFEGFVNRIISGVNLLIKGLNMLKFDMPSWLGGGHFGINIPTIPKANLPRLENGAVLKGGDPFLAWVNDQPRGQTNVETPLSTMVQAFRVAMKDFNPSQPKIEVTANGNLSELVRLLNFEIEKERRFQGNSFITSGARI